MAPRRGCRKRAGPLDLAQQAFVAAPHEGSYVLRAGPGSGKTQTVTARAKTILAAGGTVLIFSHANKTVDEIQERLRKAGAGEGCTVLTMHKFCIIRMHAARVEVPHSFDAIMEEAATGFEEGLLMAFESHIIVDEANDLSSDQSRVVAALFRRGHSVTMTGDMEQSIYGFQGSSPEHLKAFERELPPQNRYELRTNYRSSNSLLVSFANRLAHDDIRTGTAMSMDPCPGALPGERPELLAYAAESDLFTALLEKARALRARPNESVMVLAHENNLLAKAHSHLLAHGVDAVLHSSKRSQEFRRVPLRLRRAGVVQFFTIHGAKGGEADHVFLLSGEDRGDRVESDLDDGSESRRMLYVACTRARRELTVLFCSRRQPCRWLSVAWDCMRIAQGVRPYRTLPSRQGDPVPGDTLSVTKMLKDNGAQGMHAYYRSAGGVDAESLYCTAVVDLEDADGPGEPIPHQAPRAYELGLEMFVGKLFELHATVVLDHEAVKSRALSLAEGVSKLVVNKAVWRHLVESEEGKEWWKLHGGAVLRNLHQALQEEVEDDGGGESEDFGHVYLGLRPANLRKEFLSAFRYARLKFKGYEPMLASFADRVAREVLRQEQHLSPGTYRTPPAETFFRESHSYWDEAGWRAFNVLRPTHCLAFEGTLRVAAGDCRGADLCWFAVLACCWDWDARVGRRQQRDPAAWQPLLHLAQSEKSLVRLTVEQLQLSETAVEQIRADATKIRELLGAPLGFEVPNSARFACRAAYGDLALSAQGLVCGRSDVVFEGGPLEIKAVKMQPCAEHSAQALWYACVTGAEEAWLWDVYRRRLLVWEAPKSPTAFVEACLLAYLRYSPPPEGTDRVWPQEVRVAALGSPA